MESNLGKEIVKRQTLKKTLTKIKALGVTLLVLLVALGSLNLYLEGFDSEFAIYGWGIMGLGPVFFILSLLVVKRKIMEATIYEAGVVVKNGGKVKAFHFNELAGIRDTVTASSVHGLGAVGGLVGGLIGAGIDVAREKNIATNQLHSVNVVPMKGQEVPVVNTAGEELVAVYTAWLVKEKEIKKEILNDFVISFGDLLELNRGMFILKHRRGDKTLALKDVVKVSVNHDAQSVSLWGLNEKGKERPMIDVKLSKVLNVNLIHYLVKLV